MKSLVFIFGCLCSSLVSSQAPSLLYRQSLAEYENEEVVPVLVGCKNSMGENVANGYFSGQPTALNNKVYAGNVYKSRIPLLERDPNIRYVELDSLSQAADISSYALNTVQGIENSIPFANETATAPCSDPNVIRVAVIDTAFDSDHPDIQCGDVNDMETTHCIGASIGTKSRWNLADDFHGTHVTGLIAGLKNDVGIQGVVHDGNVCLLLGRVFDSGSESVAISVLVQSVEWAVAQNASVINMSISGGSRSKAFQDAINDGAAQGTVLVVSAGNTGRSGKIETIFPGAYDNVISVGALNPSSTDLADFSTRSYSVDFAVAGQDILSSIPTAFDPQTAMVTFNGNVFAAALMTFSEPIGQGLDGILVDCGIGREECPQANETTLCLIERGGISDDGDKITFLEKAISCEDSGAAGAIIFNDIPGFFTGTLSDASKVRIPIVAIGRDEGLVLRNSALGEVVMLDELGPGYGYADGTSFSAPIVAGSILALKRSCPSCDQETVDACMESTAIPLPNIEVGAGNGIVQLEDAFQCLRDNSCCHNPAEPDQDPNEQGQDPNEQDQDPNEHNGLRCTADNGPCSSSGECCSFICVKNPSNQEEGFCLPSRKNLLKERYFSDRETMRQQRGNRALRGSRQST